MMIWLNGEFLEAGAISTADRGFLLGDGLFETILVSDSAPAFLAAHLERLCAGLAALKIPTEIDGDVVRTAISKILEASSMKRGRAVARLTVSRGPGARGLKFPEPKTAAPTVLLTVASAPAPNKDIASVMISAYRRPVMSLAARHKTLNYLDNIMAANEAAEAGRGDAIMLNASGDAVCASAANIFLLTGDSGLATPPLADGALPGVVRAELIQCAEHIGIEIAEKSISEQDIRQSPIILTNSIVGLRRAAFGGVDLWRGTRQELFDRLDHAYTERLEADLQRGALP